MRSRPRADDDSEPYVALEITPGPEPVDHGTADPTFVRRPVGFVPPGVECEPRLWDGDQV